jgi:alpha-glucosidase (family GH31 glycosyl hydrolase)
MEQTSLHRTKASINVYHTRGIRLIANVKPYMLASHPEYARLRAAGAFFTDPRNGQSAEARL